MYLSLLACFLKAEALVFLLEHEITASRSFKGDGGSSTLTPQANNTDLQDQQMRFMQQQQQQQVCSAHVHYD